MPSEATVAAIRQAVRMIDAMIRRRQLILAALFQPVELCRNAILNRVMIPNRQFSMSCVMHCGGRKGGGDLPSFMIANTKS